MSRRTTIMVWIAVILFFGAYIFPLWSIDLDAPQYPEGMGMKIWMTKITGKKPHDLQNINGLNHYIGMKEIHAESIPELRFMKYIVAVLIFVGVVAALTRKRGIVAAWFVLCVVVALAGLADFYRWGYDYGHDLDPDAPIKVPGMTYQPPLFGSKQLLNITATSLPALGGAMLMTGVALAFFALLIEMRSSRKVRRGAANSARAAAVIAILITVCSCSVKPSPIEFGRDACNYCRMTIADERYGAEIVTNKGKVFKYDAVECLAAALLDEEVDPARAEMILTIDYSSPTVLVDATTASYLHSPTLRSPMGMNLTSFGDRKAAELTAERHPGEILTWSDTKRLIARTHEGVTGNR